MPPILNEIAVSMLFRAKDGFKSVRDGICLEFRHVRLRGGGFKDFYVHPDS